MSHRPPEGWVGAVVMAIAWVGSAAVTLLMDWSRWATVPLGVTCYLAGWAIARSFRARRRPSDAASEPADLRLVRRKHR